MSTTYRGDDTINEEFDDFIHTEQGPKDNSVVIAQPTLDNPITTSVPSTEDPSA